MTNNIARPKFKRKQYLVAKKFQLKYVGLILLFMFLTAALCSYVIYYTTMILMGEKLANVYPQGRLIHIVKTVNFRILLSMIFVSPLVALIGIFLSHRIAGPIGRMEKFLLNMGSGDFTGKLVLRQGDELAAVANGINSMSEGMRAIIASQKTQLIKVVGELEALKKAAVNRTKDLPEISSGISRVESEIKALEKELETYKL